MRTALDSDASLMRWPWTIGMAVYGVRRGIRKYITGHGHTNLRSDASGFQDSIWPIDHALRLSVLKQALFARAS